ncbi:MAG: hypothetical protein K8S55_00135 [Phycisphaerae bacterium]|nr:hypothetical protein [Phycisphaerae bacterium]
MNKTKKITILLLVLMNLGLLGALVHNNIPSAEAQARRAAPYKTTDYVVVTGDFANNRQGLYIIDLASNRLAAWKWDISKRRLVTIGGRKLSNDFR